jgi:predicted amidohydrolase
MAHKIALLQMTSGIDPMANAQIIDSALAEAAGEGAEMLFTPEMAGLLDSNRLRAAPHIVAQQDSDFLQHMAGAAARYGMALHIGSHPVADGDGKWRNRSFLFDKTGNISGYYDKIHLFDVTLGGGDNWRESSAYGAGDTSVIAESAIGKIGMTICYDMRFSGLYSLLVNSGAQIITVPAAFTIPTGKAHWHSLLRARAIEGQCYIIAAAQCGTHQDGRQTYGHSLVIDPWGEIILDMEQSNGLGYANISHDMVAKVRQKLPSLANQRAFATSPKVFLQ